MEKIKVLIADDFPFFRDGLRALFENHQEIELIGEAADGKEVLSLAISLEPDVILMDLNMPEWNGARATREILKVNPAIAILVLTMYDDDESVFSAMKAGARGYLLKGAGREETVRAIKTVSKGEAIFSAQIAVRMINYFHTLKQTYVKIIFPELTEREREVLALIARGKNNSEIARLLGLSPKTVRNHISSIFNKLQVTDRPHAIIRAKEAGLGD